MGPTESRKLLIGINPARDVSPHVGFRPTTPLLCDGKVMLQVYHELAKQLLDLFCKHTSPPMDPAIKFIEAAMALLDDELSGS